MERDYLLYRMKQLLASAGVPDGDELSRALELAVPVERPIVSKDSSAEDLVKAAAWAVEQAKNATGIAKELHDAIGVEFSMQLIRPDNVSEDQEGWSASTVDCMGESG